MIRNRYGVYTGVWFHYNDKTHNYDAKEVTFSRDFRGRYLNDYICRALCEDKIVVLNNLRGQKGDYYAIRIKLYPMKSYQNEKFIAVEKCGYIENTPYECDAAEIRAITVKTCVEILGAILNSIYDSCIENDGFDDSDLHNIFEEYVSDKMLNIPAMREYPESITVETAESILDEIAENIYDNIVPSIEDIWKTVRENCINWFTVDFKDDGDACANGYSLKKPSRDDKSETNMKPKYRGEWNGLPVVFTRTYGNIYASDEDCEKLCNNETVCIENIDLVLMKKKINGIFRICMTPTNKI